MPKPNFLSLIFIALLLSGTVCRPALAQTCPTEDPNIDNAKSNKLFLYFPTAADATFPNFGTSVSPAQPFDATALNSSIGTTAQVIDAIHAVVVDDYCEFNVQVIATTANPASMTSPPARRSTVAIGSDSFTTGGTLWGTSQEVDIGDQISVDFARVWAGTYASCEGGPGPTSPIFVCSTFGSLTGANATTAHWAQAIGGTAAHEGGHTYGLFHTDDDPPNDPTGQAGTGPAPGEDAFNRHLMPTGWDLTGPDRADFRRHFSDRDYGILASNVGLSVETLHNWDMVNPNAQSASSLTIDFLSTQGSMNITWSYTGGLSPWINPTLTGPSGTAVFKGTTYNKYRITWSAGNPSWNNPSSGVLAGGAVFHIGAAFTGVDFNAPDPIIIQDVTLLDASSAALALHPRLPSYDAGTLDGVTGDFALNFNAPPGAPQMRLERADILQLPRLATIDAMVGAGEPIARDRQPIRPWSATVCKVEGALGERGASCRIANLKDPAHISVVHRLGDAGVIDCSQGRLIATRAAQDSGNIPDYEGPICAGEQFDPFPSAVVYVIATFIDPSAKHYDPVSKSYVTGPVTSKVYYQFAGTRKVQGRKPGGGLSEPPATCSYCICITLIALGILLLLLLFWFLRRSHR